MDGDLPGDLPRRFGAFAVTRRLASGGASDVFLATDERCGGVVAIKRLAVERASNPEWRCRLLREATLLARIEHPGIVELRGIGEVGGSHYLVLSYLHGPSLAELVPPITAPELIRIGSQLARALAAAHACGVVHRDVKPANVLMHDGNAVLIDFGLALGRGDETLTPAGEIPGTMGYMAPELLRGGGAWNPRVDVFALGATLFELAGGRPLWSSEDPAPLHDLLDGRAPRVSLGREYEGLASVIRRAIEPDPTRRLATARQLATELQRCRRGSSHRRESPKTE